MSIYWLILLVVIILAAVVVFLLFRYIKKYRVTARQNTQELYKVKSDLGTSRTVFELNQMLFSPRYQGRYKSPVLVMAKQFRKKFELGKFAVFCSDRNLLLPLMGFGFKLKTLNALKLERVAGLISPSAHDSRSYEFGTPINGETLEKVMTDANLPGGMSSIFSYYYHFNNHTVMFIGEDNSGQLAALCTGRAFNKAVWPLLFDICRSNSNLKKSHEKIKSLQNELSSAKGELGGLSKQLKYRAIDIHSFYEISNRLFTVYDEKRLIESFIESIKRLLAPAKIVAMGMEESPKVFRVMNSSGDGSSKASTLELPSDSEIIKLMASKKKPVVLPILSSGLSEDNPFLDKALSLGFSVMEKITVGAEIKFLVLMSDKRNEKPYTDPELEILSTLANIASVALNNIYQYSLIEKMSYTDYLTEIYNYRYFYKRLREEIYRAKRFDRTLALVIFDIDNFKLFNDTYGHQAGDEVLKNMSGLVMHSVRAIDIVSRYGGEEFCIIMPDTGFANCLIFVERLRKMIEGHKFASKIVDEGYGVTISIGGAIYPVDAQSPDRLIYCADMALLKSKGEGRNRSMMFNSLMLEDESLVKHSQQQLSDTGIYEDL